MLHWLARRRVAIGTLFLVLVLLFAHPTEFLWWVGLIVAAYGEAVRTWASGYLFKLEKLATRGPFSVLRNPLYFGSFWLGFGITFMGGNGFLILLYPILFVPIYLRKIEQEEAQLVDRFGAQAIRYMERVPRLVPTPSGYEKPAEHWNLHRVVFVHREWGNWLLLALFASWFYAG